MPLEEWQGESEGQGVWSDETESLLNSGRGTQRGCGGMGLFVV